MRSFFVLMSLGYMMWLIVAGCTPATHHFSREVLDREDESSSMDLAFRQDVAACQRAVVSESNRQALMETAHVMFLERDMNRCLEEKGWISTPTGDHAYRFDQWMEDAVVAE